MRIACITPDRKQDYLVSTVLEGLTELDHVELVVSDPGNGVTNPRMSDEDFIRQANACDAVIVFFGKVRGNQPVRRYLLDNIRLPREKLVYVDGSEWRADGWDTPRQVINSLDDPRLRRGDPWIDEEMWERCGHYFKRECWPQDISQYGVKPLPFALCKRHRVQPLTKTVEVFCAFGHTKTGLRREAIEVVQRVHAQYTGCKIGAVPYDEYTNTLQRSRIIVDAWGGGDTTDRFWEGVGARACVLYQRHNVVTPHPFVDNEHAISWTTPQELENHLHTLIKLGNEAETIGVQGLGHALRFHTAKHRALEVLSVLEG